MSFKSRSFAPVLFSLASLSAPFLSLSLAHAQVVSTNGGSIQGTITDASGAAVPGATVDLLSTDTGFKKQLKTDNAGFYSVGPLNPGAYRVKVTAQGFQGLQVDTVVRIGTATTGSFKLTVGEATETVEVNAGAVQLNTDQAGVSDVLTAQQIQSLPINGRNFLDVAQIEPGVILQAGGSFDPTKAGYSAISVSGVSGRTTRILLDGQDITDETVGTTIFNVSQGSIGEFQLNRSTQDVSGDVTSTGQVLVATQSGTNQFHGELFYNFQDARSLFATEFGSQPPFQRNQFGGSIGGPILKDKLFFFGNSERIKQDSSQPAQIGSQFPQFQGLAIPSPYRETYSTVRLDYNGPAAGHYFVRANYNVNSLASNFGQGFNIYANRDNTPGIAGGADFQFGHWTHSFRGSYEKFHNLIADDSAVSPIDLLPGITFQNVTQGLYTGPNYLAPQGTFQSDKQIRYDGSWIRGAHTVRFGYNLNYILGGGYAAFFGLAPRVRETAGTVLAVCALPGSTGPCADDPVNGYSASSIVLGNGQGFFTENPGFGLIGGGVHDWRQAAYAADTWKVTPNFTLVAGLRWSVDTDRANQDLPADPTIAQFRSDFNHSVHQPYGNFAPQVGFNWATLGGKTVFRAGAGIFYEGDVFNNTTNARTGLLKNGAFFNDQSVCASGSLTQPDGTTITTVTANGTTESIRQMCSGSVGAAAPFAIALQQLYQQNTSAHATSQNGGYVGFTGDASGLYAPIYRTPYAEQLNFGIQQQLFKGAVLTADYVHNSSIKIAQGQDVNHVGAARYLNTTAARNAIAATVAAFPSCPQGSGSASIDCAIANGAGIDDFAGNGLDSGTQFLGSYSAAARGLTPDTGAAFPGLNPNLGSGNFLMPIGRSGYDALQVVFKQQISRHIAGIERSNLQISYSLSRIVSSSAGGSDQFFSNNSWDNDNPNAYMGRATLDHKHEISFGGNFLLKYGPEIGLIGHFFSALPQNLTLDASDPVSNIFTSDVTGDGTVGDLVPGTLPGDYMHRVKPTGVSQLVNNYNANYAGRPSPAGQALINAGLMTQGQLSALGGVLQTLPTVTGATLANPSFRQVDATFGYPIRLGKYSHLLGESAMLEPRIAFYNVGNFANFGGNSGNPGVTPFGGDLGGAPQPGNINGPTGFDVINPYRVTRQSGTYDQGAPRTTEYQLRLTF